MALEDLMLIFLILLPIVVWVVGWVRDKKEEKYILFDKEYPVGSFFFADIADQKFPYGKWKCLGRNIDGTYVFERVK